MPNQDIIDIALAVATENGVGTDTLVIGMMVTALGKLQREHEAAVSDTRTPLWTNDVIRQRIGSIAHNQAGGQYITVFQAQSLLTGLRLDADSALAARDARISALEAERDALVNQRDMLQTWVDTMVIDDNYADDGGG